jgi:hypothetical protein
MRVGAVYYDLERFQRRVVRSLYRAMRKQGQPRDAARRVARRVAADADRRAAYR